jgi:dihydroflavonol-4-reductase
MFRNNVGGTSAVLEAALENNISRVVYTSSVGTLGNPGNGVPGTEDTPVSLAHMVGPYKKSKFLAEREAEKFIARGLELVIVNPSTPVGPWDIKPTPTGKIIVDFLKRMMPAYLDTGLN